MKKRRGFLLLVAVLTALLLCGCSQYDDKYDEEEFLTDGMNHYTTVMWWGNTQEDGTYALDVGSFSGVRILGSFTVEKDQTLCEVTSTLIGTKGEAKLLVVNAEDKTLNAQWPLDSQNPMTVTLPAGRYDLRIAGKSAGFEGQVSLSLNGQTVSWDNMLEKLEEMAADGRKDRTDSPRETFDNERKAA